MALLRSSVVAAYGGNANQMFQWQKKREMLKANSVRISEFSKDVNRIVKALETIEAAPTDHLKGWQQTINEVACWMERSKMCRTSDKEGVQKLQVRVDDALANISLSEKQSQVLTTIRQWEKQLSDQTKIALKDSRAAWRVVEHYEQKIESLRSRQSKVQVGSKRFLLLASKIERNETKLADAMRAFDEANHELGRYCTKLDEESWVELIGFVAQFASLDIDASTAMLTVVSGIKTSLRKGFDLDQPGDTVSVSTTSIAALPSKNLVLDHQDETASVSTIAASPTRNFGLDHQDDVSMSKMAIEGALLPHEDIVYSDVATKIDEGNEKAYGEAEEIEHAKQEVEAKANAQEDDVEIEKNEEVGFEVDEEGPKVEGKEVYTQKKEIEKEEMVEKITEVDKVEGYAEQEEPGEKGLEVKQAPVAGAEEPQVREKVKAKKTFEEGPVFVEEAGAVFVEELGPVCVGEAEAVVVGPAFEDEEPEFEEKEDVDDVDQEQPKVDKDEPEVEKIEVEQPVQGLDSRKRRRRKLGKERLAI